jgi:hypothetical protein
VLGLPRLNDVRLGHGARVHRRRRSRGLERIISVAEGVPFLVEELLVSPGVPTSFAEPCSAGSTN